MNSIQFLLIMAAVFTSPNFDKDTRFLFATLCLGLAILKTITELFK
jgi:hypothetical protein